MLIGEATKNGTGIIILGDNFDLKSLHDTLHILAGDEETAVSNCILSFAYEVRKSFEGHRGNKKFVNEAGTNTYFSFKLFWADFIVTLNLLRERIGYFSTTREMQANLYRLEAFAESTIISYAPEISADILKYIFSIRIPYFNYLESLVGYIIQNCLVAPPGKKRFHQLSKELILLNPYSNEHKEFKNILEQEARRLGCDIDKVKYELIIDEKYKW
jgi:hypothetical protein